MAVKRYNGSSWDVVAGVGAQGAAATSSTITTWVKTASGGETSLSGNDDSSQSLSYTIGQELVFINGVLQKRGADYTANTGTSITGLAALTASDVVTVWSNNAFSVSNAISNTIVDAKGDVLVGTSADTPGRLAAGTNNQVLTVDSSQATGLKYANGSAATLTTTGDLLYASAANTPARLGIGSTSQVLTVSGGVPTWATPSSGGMTSIASGSLSGSVTTVGSFSSAYTDLYLVITDVSGDTSGSLSLRINGDTVADRHVNSYMQAEVGQPFQSGQSITTQILTATGALNTPDNNNAVYLYIRDYNNSTVRKNYQLQAITNSGGNNATCAMVVFGGYQGTSAVTSIEIRISAGSFDGGTYILYGVK